VIVHGRSWTGTDGVYQVDQMQYLAWIRDASRHVLVSNLFVLTPAPADYFQPLIGISGGLVALGLAPSVALLVWKPVAVGAVFFGTRAFVHRGIPGRGARRVALVLALFGGWVGMFVDLWLPFWTWGYPFALIAVASALAALLMYERARDAGRLPWTAALLGGVASWLHPWQGETLILIVLGAEALMWTAGQRPRTARLLLVVGAAALPLAYYAALAGSDPSWRLAQQAAGGTYPLGQLALALAPLAVPAALAYRARAATFIAAATRIWPLAALITFLLAERGIGSSSMHAFLGISVPLAVLAVEGAKTVRWPALAPRGIVVALAVLTLTVPVTVDQLGRTRRFVLPRFGPANFISRPDGQALDYVADSPGPGGVLTDYYLGVRVPGETGRRTYLGDSYWSQPDWPSRVKMTHALLRAQLRAGPARAFVLRTGAGFVLADCSAHTDLRILLAPIISSVHRFGCASVYTIKHMPNGHTLLGARRTAMVSETFGLLR
jgi:hypothetical protein